VLFVKIELKVVYFISFSRGFDYLKLKIFGHSDLQGCVDVARHIGLLKINADRTPAVRQSIRGNTPSFTR
jgi:hypothetical protein